MDNEYIAIVVLMVIIIILLCSLVATFCVFYVCRFNSKEKKAGPKLSEINLRQHVPDIEDIENSYAEISDIGLELFDFYMDDTVSDQFRFLSDGTTVKTETVAYIHQSNDIKADAIKRENSDYYVLEHDCGGACNCGMK